MATKPELLDQDTTIDDNDIVIKTSSSSVSKTIKFSNLFSVVAGKIADAISAANSAIWTAIYNKIKTITLDSPNTMSKDPINSTCLNSSLANLIKQTNINYEFTNDDANGGVSPFLYYKKITIDRTIIPDNSFVVSTSAFDVSGRPCITFYSSSQNAIYILEYYKSIVSIVINYI